MGPVAPGPAHPRSLDQRATARIRLFAHEIRGGLPPDHRCLCRGVFPHPGVLERGRTAGKSTSMPRSAESIFAFDGLKPSLAERQRGPAVLRPLTRAAASRGTTSSTVRWTRSGRKAHDLHATVLKGLEAPIRCLNTNIRERQFTCQCDRAGPWRADVGGRAASVFASCRRRSDTSKGFTLLLGVNHGSSSSTCGRTWAESAVL